MPLIYLIAGEQSGDILGARPMTPTDSGRAAVVFDNYRRGQISSTPQEPLVDGRISGAVE